MPLDLKLPHPEVLGENCLKIHFLSLFKTHFINTKPFLPRFSLIQQPQKASLIHIQAFGIENTSFRGIRKKQLKKSLLSI